MWKQHHKNFVFSTTFPMGLTQCRKFLENKEHTCNKQQSSILSYIRSQLLKIFVDISITNRKVSCGSCSCGLTNFIMKITAFNASRKEQNKYCSYIMVVLWIPCCSKYCKIYDTAANFGKSYFMLLYLWSSKRKCPYGTSVLQL